MSSPTPPDLPAETRAAPARKIKLLVWILGGIGLLLVCAALAVGFLAVRAVKNAGFAFRFDPAKKTLVMIGGDGKEVKTSAADDQGHSRGGTEQKVLIAWLAQHPEYRAAVDADCACDELLRLNPGAHPYTATGDFAHDGKTDFAAAVINKQTGRFALLIFNGPIGGDPVKPALFLVDLDLRRQGLFFGLSFEEPPRLYLGYYNSDDFWRFVPTNTYVLEDVLPDSPPAGTSFRLKAMSRTGVGLVLPRLQTLPFLKHQQSGGFGGLEPAGDSLRHGTSPRKRLVGACGREPVLGGWPDPHCPPARS